VYGQDKTGTLTEAKIRLARQVALSGADSEHVLDLARLNSRFQAGLRNPLDTAMEAATVIMGIEQRELLRAVNPIGVVRRARAVGIASRDQQRPIADHLRQPVSHPLGRARILALGRARILDAIGQALGDPEPLLDRRQQQYSSIRRIAMASARRGRCASIAALPTQGSLS